jgi:hypothetical protein
VNKQSKFGIPTRRQARDGSNRGRDPIHGKTGSPEYSSWVAMCGRCNDPKDPAYGRYGGRGITVDSNWFGPGGFERFFTDMGPRPAGTSLDRINNDGNYEPGNCRWATAKEQAQNRRNTVLIQAMGKTQCLADWARETGIPEDTLRVRIRRLGWPVDIALTRPLAKQSVPGRPVVKPYETKGGRHG